MAKLLERTHIAYMYQFFSRYEWEACIYHLQAIGLSPDEVTVFLCSKHMRWANDGKPTNRKVRCSDMIHYIHRNFPTTASLKVECQELLKGA